MKPSNPKGPFYVCALLHDGWMSISGLGRNAGTLDASCESMRTARRWARQLQAKQPSWKIRIETNIEGEAWYL